MTDRLKKIVILIAILFSVPLCIAPQKAEAHFLAADKNIGAVLHVDPNDEPVAGAPASFFFEFKDKENKFDPKNCDCTFVIKENGQEIYSQSLFENNEKPSLENASVVYTFPQKDVYQVQVVGKPNSRTPFQSFTLSWDFRVDQEVTQSTQGSGNFFTEQLLHVAIAGIIVVLLLGFFIYEYLHKKKNKGKGGEKKDEENTRNIY